MGLKLTQKGILFNNIIEPDTRGNSMYTHSRYKDKTTGQDITRSSTEISNPANKFINAIDIDWNGAQLTKGDGSSSSTRTINTTGDLLDVINKQQEQIYVIASAMVALQGGNYNLDYLDFDGDGIVSIIDYTIVKQAAVGSLNNDPKYDNTNLTYNGKSLDINGDGTVDISDCIAVANMINDQYKGTYIANIETKIYKYYKKHNYTWPTLSYVKLMSDFDEYDFDDDGIVSIIDYNILMFEILDRLNPNDPKYDSINKTYNGKSLDISDDGSVSALDANILISKIRNIIPADIILANADIENNKIKNFYESNNRFPTLEELEDL